MLWPALMAILFVLDGKREKGKGTEPCIANKKTSDCNFCNLFTPEQRTHISTPSYKLKKDGKREKGKGTEPCIANKKTSDCNFCNLFTPEQRAHISTPSYKLKKEKREAKRLDSSTPTNDSSLVDPSAVSVIRVVGDAKSDKSPVLPPEKKLKKDKAPTKAKKGKASTSTSDDRISELDQKWSERFNRLEALLLSKSLQPTFSSKVRITPSHSLPTNIARDTEPFFQPTSRTLDDPSTPQRTGRDFGAAQQPSAGKLPTDSSASGS